MTGRGLPDGARAPVVLLPAREDRDIWRYFASLAFPAEQHVRVALQVLADSEGRQRVDDILEAQREKVIAVLEANRDVHAALRDALIARDELIRDDILEVIEQALSART